MAREPISSAPAALYQLQQPEKLNTVLERDKYDDCLTCKLKGVAAFIGLGGYSYFSGQHQLQLRKAEILKSGSRFGIKSRQAGITGIALSLVGMGVWRLLN